MKDFEQLSMIETAEALMEKKKTPQPIKKIIKEVAEVKGLAEDDVDFMTQLYTDITSSAKFVYCKDDLWDLKKRQSLDLWDKDGSYFNTGEDVVEEPEEDGITLGDYNLEEEEVEEIDDDDIVCASCGETLTAEEVEENRKPEGIICPKCGKLVTKRTVRAESDDEEDVEFIDEEEYNGYMDDYEDLYDKE